MQVLLKFLELNVMLRKTLIELARDFVLNSHQLSVELRVVLLGQGHARQRRQIKVSVVPEQLTSLLLQVLILLLKEVLFAAEVIVKNDLLF